MSKYIIFTNFGYYVIEAESIKDCVEKCDTDKRLTDKVVLGMLLYCEELFNTN